ncbi:hypothetical protein [Methylopila sp. 73B]|uniref:hypothetical protein n=1 Tax=Methylopila sp. 73B TaxID=1120792 RepID=UPI00036EAC19|nr:hypothetical protein [Methylopila sp. 73B]
MAKSFKRVIPGRDFRGLGLPSSRVLLPAFRADMFAAYVPRSGGSEVPGYDYSGHGRHSNTSNAKLYSSRARLGVDADGTGVGRDIVMPFNANDLVAANTACSIVGVVAAGAGAFIAGSLFGTEQSLALIETTTDNGRATVISDTAPVHTTLDSGAPDATRGSRFEMIAASYLPAERIVYRRRLNTAMQATPPTTTPKTLGGARPFKSGINAQGSNYAGYFDLAALVFFGRKLDAGEMEAVYLSLQDYLSKTTGVTL